MLIQDQESALFRIRSQRFESRKHEAIPDIVRQLTAGSSTAEASISLSGDKRFIVSDDQRAYIAYADTGRTLVAKGDPVGDKCRWHRCDLGFARIG